MPETNGMLRTAAASFPSCSPVFSHLYLFMQKSLSLSFFNLQSFLLSHQTPSTAAKVRFLTSLQKKQSAPKSLHFYSYKYRFGALCSSPDSQPEWPLTDSFLLFVQTLTKFTSTPLIDWNHQHGTGGRYRGARQNEHSGG